LPAFHQISPDQYRISQGDRWKVFILYGFGEKFPNNCARCPETTRLLERVPELQTAWFSILSPRYHIPKHRGVTKGILRVHLGLKVPVERRNCRMQVDDQMVVWEEGRGVVFDDFYHHEVWNDTDEERVVLLFDFNRPMRLPGRLVNRFLLWGVKQSAYVRDARNNMLNWEQRQQSAVQRAESMFDEPASPA
jgi:beta-hydroxylase